MITWFARIARSHPPTVWYLAAGGAITAVGASMVFPLFTLFLTAHRGIDLTAAGALVGLSAIGGMAGRTAGGQLADTLGRRPVMLVSVIGSAAASLVVGFAPSIELIAPAVILLGALTSGFRPAGNAMVADLIPPEDRARVFALLRVAFNAGFAVGPALAGLILATGREGSGQLDPAAYQPLFVIDAATSAVFGLILARKVQESRPSGFVREPGGRPDLGGYRAVLANRPFVWLTATWALLEMVYVQLFSTMGPFLARDGGFPVEQFAALLSVNAAMVVLLQLLVTRAGLRLGLANALRLGALLEGGGLAVALLGATLPTVLLLIVVFTFGEMLLAPTAETLAAGFADESNRGRYFGAFSLAQGVGMALGPVAGATLVQRGLGEELWLIALGLTTVAAISLGRLAGMHERRATATDRVTGSASSP